MLQVLPRFVLSGGAVFGWCCLLPAPLGGAASLIGLWVVPRTNRCGRSRKSGSPNPCLWCLWFLCFFFDSWYLVSCCLGILALALSLSLVFVDFSSFSQEPGGAQLVDSRGTTSCEEEHVDRSAIWKHGSLRSPPSSAQLPETLVC